MDDKAFDEIMRAFHNLRAAFLRAHLSAPKSIELGDFRDGDVFRYYMPKDMFLAQPRMNENDPEWVVNIQGIELRMPARWRQETLKSRRLI